MTIEPREGRVGVLYHKGLRTGGPEALHQLVKALTDSGREAFLVPHPDTASASSVPEFAHYGCREGSLEDLSADDLLVAPEIYVDLALDLRSCRRAIWWLSIDNSPAFFSFAGWLTGRHGPRTLSLVPRAVVRSWRSRRLRRALRVAADVEHLFQSHYSRLVVGRRLGKDGADLTDYISLPGERRDVVRRPAVAYNPAKGGPAAARVRSRVPEVEFVPLVGMTPGEVAAALAASTVYLDMGHHPGRDRIPREAASLGCVVVVARRGSAINDVDVPIPEAFKVSGRRGSAREAAGLLRTCLRDPSTALAAQRSFVEIIRTQKDTFYAEVEEVFCCGPAGDSSGE